MVILYDVGENLETEARLC